MKNKDFKVILVSTPWPLYDRPSIQLGALKAYLKAMHTDVEVYADHAFLSIAAALGYPLYREISERTWLSESVYAALLYPDRFDIIEKFFNRHARPGSLARKAGFEEITSAARKATDALIAKKRWKNFHLAGFSVSLCQLTSALYFIKRIKAKAPGLLTAVGGSTFSGSVTSEFFKVFGEIDLVVNGEGELPLSRLIDHLKTSESLTSMPSIAGVVTADNVKLKGECNRIQQLKHLYDLPVPDFDDYFNRLTSSNPQQVFFPTLPVETSRGCWWQRRSARCKSTGCAFCNLNLQWKGYRSKPSAQVAAEIDYLTTKYRTLSVAIVDNVLPKRPSNDLFKKLAGLNKDLRIFAEIRATTTCPELSLMASAGIQEVQIGIEALATSLLKKLNKGTTAIQNLEIMRDCEALGIKNTSNLILHFPGSDEQDVTETLRSLDFVEPYRPLKAVGFWLGLGSPVWQNPEIYQIKAVFNHPNWKSLFPGNVRAAMKFIIQAYRGNLGHQRLIWRSVTEKVDAWRHNYNALSTRLQGSPALELRDGGDFLIIRQHRIDHESIHHRLVGTSRQIYLYCRRHRSIKQIRKRFPAFAEDKILAFLKIMVGKKLMFQEGDRYLSLAIPVKPSGTIR